MKSLVEETIVNNKNGKSEKEKKPKPLADPKLAALLEELESGPAPSRNPRAADRESGESRIAVPLQLASDNGPLSFISTTTVIGTAADVTLAEITIETFFPADRETAQAMRELVLQS